jgi:hypothetical protein
MLLPHYVCFGLLSNNPEVVGFYRIGTSLLFFRSYATLIAKTFLALIYRVISLLLLQVLGTLRNQAEMIFLKMKITHQQKKQELDQKNIYLCS